jgi:hypothetical protein
MSELYNDTANIATSDSDNNNSFQIDNNNNIFNCQPKTQLSVISFNGHSQEISINWDTEYFEKYNTSDGNFDKKIITVQSREHEQDTARLYTHSDMYFENELPAKIDDKELSKLVNLQPLDTDLPAVFAYLADIAKGKFEIFPSQNKRNKKNPSLTLNIYGHFLVVDFYGIFQYSENLINSQIKKALCQGNIKYTKNLDSNYKFRVKGSDKDTSLNFIPIYGIEIKVKQGDNTFIYNLNIKFTDTFGRLGPLSYLNYANTIGYELPSKGLMDNDDKSDMLSLFKNKTENVIRYALGDCESSKMIKKTDILFDDISHNLRIPTVQTRPTIGGTVNRIITNFLLKETENKLDLKEHLTHTASNLKQFDGTTRLLLSVIFGGRCFSNNHVARIINSIIIDIDFEGAYNSVLNAIGFNFYLGNPTIFTLPLQSPKYIRNRKLFDMSKGVTLREYLKENQSKFIPFGYQIVVCSNSDNMKINQDLLVSKFNIQISYDKDTENDYLKEKTGVTKVKCNEVFNAVICHSSLELILTDSDKNTTAYLLDNLIVVASAFYDKEKQCQDISELNGDNWYSIPIYKLTSYIRALRECYKPKTPLNTLYKLLANTCYGVLASPYFDVSNPIVANNITDTVRVSCYLLEKTFNGIKSITDGCQTDINNIFVNRHAKNSININNSVRLNNLTKTDLHTKHLKRTSLLDSDWSCNYENNDYALTNTTTGITYNQKGINNLLLELLLQNREQLPMFSTSIIKSQNTLNGSQDNLLCENNGQKFYYNPIEKKGIISIEIKSVNDYGSFHGSANYLLHDINKNNDTTIKYRSYKTMGYYQYTDTKIDLAITPCESPAKVFLTQLVENPTKVKRCQVFMKKQILMPNQYIAIPDKWDKLGYKIGDSIPLVGYLTEFTISNYMFNNFNDYDLIQKESQSLKNKYGQSFESWFINSDGTLNYEKMNNTIAQIIPILNGKKLSVYLNRIKKLSESEKYHPCHKEKITIKEKIFLPWIEYQKCQKSKKYSNDDLWADLFDIDDINDIGKIGLDPDNLDHDLAKLEQSMFDDLF